MNPNRIVRLLILLKQPVFLYLCTLYPFPFGSPNRDHQHRTPSSLRVRSASDEIDSCTDSVIGDDYRCFFRSYSDRHQLLFPVVGFHKGNNMLVIAGFILCSTRFPLASHTFFPASNPLSLRQTHLRPPSLAHHRRHSPIKIVTEKSLSTPHLNLSNIAYHEFSHCLFCGGLYGSEPPAFQRAEMERLANQSVDENDKGFLTEAQCASPRLGKVENVGDTQETSESQKDYPAPASIDETDTLSDIDDSEVHPGSILVEGTLGNFRLCDCSLGTDHVWGWIFDIRNQGAESLIQSYSPEDDHYEGYNFSLSGKLSSIRIQELLTYLVALAPPVSEEAIKFVDKVGGFEWLIKKYEMDGAAARKLDLSLETPIIVVPRDSNGTELVVLPFQLQFVHNHIICLVTCENGLSLFLSWMQFLGSEGSLHIVVSDKDYGIITNCLAMNLGEQPDYLKMMWLRIDFLRSFLELGYNFLFTVLSEAKKITESRMAAKAAKDAELAITSNTSPEGVEKTGAPKFPTKAVCAESIWNCERRY
ncbi:unnamed protein product [Lactuca virosa]|uniref:Nucleotide-diphospho-sugar transferase domain-containing protein n=1 Tax=Lactuca virosa TaxID=75947 RepID=A0AAU9NTP2_9ASTR|nr:unnamed protein product [Lactuca virosa]